MASRVFTVTVASALGPAARPLASTLAHWVKAPAWRRRLVRVVYPGLAKALDELARGIENVIGPL